MADDLDALLRDLITSSSKPAASASADANVNINELDSLINNLSSEPKPQTTASSDDLDNLMSSLSSPTSTQVKPAPTSTAKSDDLDDLLGELSSVSVSAPASKPAPASRPAPTAQASGDSLDDLLSELSSSGPAPTSNKTASTPASKPKANADSLDDLLGQLSQPTTQPTSQPSVNASGSNKTADLDSLLNTLSSNSTDMGALSGAGAQGICAKCGKPITGQITTALGKSFHPEHFTCNTCQKILGTSTFYDVGGMPQCEQCFKSLSCPRCGYCDQPILDRYITALGKKWHPEHFICAQCLQPFANGAFFERDGKPYCESCFYSMYAYRCASCNEVIRGECVTAFGVRWHPEHFNCQYCHEPFKDGAFFEYQGKPYCELHYHQLNGSLCSGCGKAVGSRSLTALGRKWHPEHFVCAFCMNPLAGTSFKEGKGKPYCTTCYNKLFGQ